MAYLARNLGLELPVYNQDTVILSGKHDFKNAATGPESTFVRRVRLRALGYTSLKEALAHADKVFEAVCEPCEASIVGHNWGLYRTDDQALLVGAMYPCFVDKYILVAEVDIIRGLAGLQPYQFDSIMESLRRNAETASGPVWSEGNPYQFANGYAPNNSCQKLWLLDIEPTLENKQNTNNTIGAE